MLPFYNIRDRVLLLRSMPAMAPLDQDSLILLAEHARPRTFAAGDVLMVEGSPIDHVHLVVDGHVAVTKEGRHVARVDRGYGVGFISLLSLDDTGIHAVAEDRVHTFELPAEVLLHAFEESFPLVRNGLRIQASTLLERRGSLPADPRNPPVVELGTYREHDLTLVERIIEYRKNPVFANANIDAVGELARSNVEVRYQAGALLWQRGDASTFSLRIDYGRICCTNRAGEHVDIGSGYVLGALDAFSMQPRSYEARAETAVVAHRTNLETFLAVLEAHPDVAMNLAAVLARAQLRP